VHLVGFYYKNLLMSVTPSTRKWTVERVQVTRFSRTCYDQDTGNELHGARHQFPYQGSHIPGNLLHK